ncbi:VWA domain-containing protein [Microbulbifer halophilus]|uniref:VWA domain-containing protein n=1 Tax=Microbulbifer halophilus TaxID=453963 RepID=A0ABW5EJG8_9GAMM|nr:VWA domain-containing protein [Microbulbifer halophilus]MCW8128354.1 VWA domain-containing protein [Microbulbifer halophilus]
MNLFTDLHQFHFLRPALLWLLIPTALLCWALARTVINSGQLQKVIDADLLPHLLLRGGAKRPWLFGLIFALLAAAIIALAGPAWRKLPTPVYSNQDALVILLDLSPSMMATDLSPDRLTRARLKILDILRQREDGLTALVAYGGEAHIVTPLTEDTDTIANLVPSLSPSIVPVPGSNIEMAVETGIQLLKDGASGRGQLLAITDGIDETALDTVAGLVASQDFSLSILAVGSDEGSPIPRGDSGGFVTDNNGSIIIADFDAGQLGKLARDSGGQFAEISVTDGDIAALLPKGDTPEQAQLTEREFDQWREEGPWLLLLLLPVAALLFRRGALACALPFAFLLLPPTPTQAAENDLWLRDDQRATQLLEEGKADQAAKTFKNPQWRGTANYRAGDYPAAQKDFAQSGDARDLYNLGNSLAQQGRYSEAIEAYDEALKQQPQMADAEHNRDIARKLKELQEKQQQQEQQQSGQDQQQKQDQKQQQSDQGQQQQQQNQQQDQQNAGSQNDQQSQGSPRDQQSDEQPQNGEQQQNAEQQRQQGQPENGEEQEQQGEQQRAKARESDLDPETQQALDQWLRQIPDDPAGLMREKFKYESLQRRRAYRSGEWQPPENGASQRW